MPMNCSVALKLLPLASYKFYSSKGEHYYEKKLFNLCHTDFCLSLIHIYIPYKMAVPYKVRQAKPDSDKSSYAKNYLHLFLADL